MKYFVIRITFGFFLSSALFLTAYVSYSFAQPVSGCALIKVGNPPANEQLPPGCAGNGSATAQAVIALGKAHLNGTYVWGAPPRNWPAEDPNAGKAPTTFDCSGFAGWTWYWGSGGKVNIPGQTDAVWNGTGPWQKHVTTDKAQLQPGDLVYFGTPATTHHVGIYEGNGACGSNDCFLEYYDTGLPGRENSLSKEPDYVGFVRINL